MSRARKLGFLAAAAALLGPVAARAAPSPISRFAALPAGLAPGALAPGAGAEWFTDSGARAAVGRITAAGAITEYRAGLPSGATLAGLTADGPGNAWVTVAGSSPAVAEVSAAGRITLHSSGLNPGSIPTGITVGPDGAIWFTDEGAVPAVGRLDPASGSISEYTLGLPLGSRPQGIAAGPDGAVWFTDPAAGAIGRIATGGGLISEYGQGLEPGEIVLGADRNMWFTDGAALGRITTSGAVTRFASGLGPHPRLTDIAAASDGTLWFADPGDGEVGHGNVVGTIAELPGSLHASGTAVDHVAAGRDGAVWWSDAAARSISRGSILPVAVIFSPHPGQRYVIDSDAVSDFTCVPGIDGDPITSCLDGGGEVPPGVVFTSQTGSFTYRVTATDAAGRRGTAGAIYSVILPPPTPRPAITGTPGRGGILHCVTHPLGASAIAYGWNRDGTPIAGAASATYRVLTADEGTSLTCTATASYGTSSGTPATSPDVPVPVTRRPGAPAAGGSMGRGAIGPLRLGMGAAAAARALAGSAVRHTGSVLVLTATPSPLVAGLGGGHVIWIATADARYGVRGVRVGAGLAYAEGRLALTQSLNGWYFVAGGFALRVAGGVVREVAVVAPSLSRTASARARLARELR